MSRRPLKCLAILAVLFGVVYASAIEIYQTQDKQNFYWMFYEDDGSRFFTADDGRALAYSVRVDTAGNGSNLQPRAADSSWTQPKPKWDTFIIYFYDNTPRTVMLVDSAFVPAPMVPPGAFSPDSMYSMPLDTLLIPDAQWEAYIQAHQSGGAGMPAADFDDSLAAQGFVNADSTGGPLATRYWAGTQYLLLTSWPDSVAVTASTELSDTADLLYEAELDAFSELQTQIGDKTLVNEEDVCTIDANWVNTANPWANNEVADDITASNYLLLTAYGDSLVNYDGDGIKITDLDAIDVLVDHDGALEIVDDSVNVKADGIKDTHVDWGTGVGQVSSDDVTEGSTNKYMPALVLLTYFPEYPGALLDTLAIHGANNDGSMTTVQDSVSTTLRYNAYKWTSTEATSQYYVVKLMLQLPSDFSCWGSTADSCLAVYYKTGLGATTNNSLEVDVYEDGDAAVRHNGAELQSTSWARYEMGPTTIGGGWAANNRMRIWLIMKANSTSSAATWLGRVEMRYER